MKGSKLYKACEERTFIAILRYLVPGICFPQEKKKKKIPTIVFEALKLF